jgi:LPXTG-motif cell wall-anchored protein
VQVVVDTEIPAERDTARTASSMPRPSVDVFLDDRFQGAMRDDNNVVQLENVEPGPHEIVLLAKNVSGEIIDRKVVNIMAVAPSAPKPVVAAPVNPPPAPAPPAPSYEPPPAPPAPVTTEQVLPATATSDPLLAVAGVVLLLAGLAIRRFA